MYNVYILARNMAQILEKWYKEMSKVEPAVADGFEYITRFSVRNPYKTMSAVFFIVMCLMIGFTNFYFVTDAEDLWIPKASAIISANDFRDEHYTPDIDVGTVLFTGANVLTLDSFNHLWDIFEGIKEITIDDLDYNDMCVLSGTAVCTSYGPLQFWS